MNDLDLKEDYRFPAKIGDEPWLLFVSFNKSLQREDFCKAAPKLKGKGIVIRNDLAPCLIAERNKLKKVSDKLKENPTNYRTKIRDTPFNVWLEVLKPGGKMWEAEEEGKT